VSRAGEPVSYKLCIHDTFVFHMFSFHCLVRGEREREKDGVHVKWYVFLNGTTIRTFKRHMLLNGHP
jgi:hypothetical protein